MHTYQGEVEAHPTSEDVQFLDDRLGLDHRVGHPTPFEPIPMLVAAD